MNSNNPYQPNELAAHRLEISNAKNDGNEDLTFPTSKNNGAHGAAAQKVRQIKGDASFNKLENSNDFEELKDMLKEL